MKACLLIFVLLVALNNVFGIIPASKLDFEVDPEDIFVRELVFKHSLPDSEDQLRCSAIKVDPKEEQFIIGIEPIADKRIAHHFTVAACKGLPRHVEDHIQEGGNTWLCGGKEGLGMCGPGEDENNQDDDDQKVFFFWALNAKGIRFEDGVGVKVGGKSGYNYIVAQVHYNKPPAHGDDSLSRYIFTITRQPLPYQVGIYELRSHGRIPPRRKKFTLDTACDYNLPYPIIPIRFRSHGHEIVDIISCYAIQGEEWKEIGRMSPHQAQAFYEVTNKDLVVDEGDILAARCILNSESRITTTHTGGRHVDEMCIFYVMYYTDFQGNLIDGDCPRDGMRFTWERNIDVKTSPPKNHDTLDGVHLPNPDLELKTERYRVLRGEIPPVDPSKH